MICAWPTCLESCDLFPLRRSLNFSKSNKVSVKVRQNQRWPAMASNVLFPAPRGSHGQPCLLHPVKFFRADTVHAILAFLCILLVYQNPVCAYMLIGPTEETLPNRHCRADMVEPIMHRAVIAEPILKNNQEICAWHLVL